MKSIRKLKNATKTLAGSALLIGATLTGAAGMAAADNHQNDLGDYPTPFVGEDGEVQSTIVVGESAATVDVVGAINIAGSLGQEAYSTETVSVEGGSGGSWSASNGVTLDTQNDNLFFNSNINDVRETLTGSDLTVLESTEFRADDGDTTEIEQYLYPNSQQITYGNSPDGLDEEDPVLYIDNPDNVDSGSHLFRLQANFEDGLDFTSEDVQGEEVEFFGNTYTVSKDSASDELILYGSQEEVSVSSGEETTVTIDGEEVSFGVEAVTESDVAAITIDGDLDEYDEDETFNVNGQEVRIDNVIQTSDSQSSGTVSFAIGSEEMRFSGGNIEDENEDEYDGVSYQTNGGGDSGFDSLSSLTVYVGTDDDDKQYVTSGESYSHPLFQDVEFHFGGLNPDTMEDGEEIAVEPSEDETVTASFTSGDESATVEFFNRDTGSNSNELADSDGDAIIAVEGAAVQEDEYVVTDAGDFTHMWEVNSVDVDEEDLVSNGESGDEAVIELTDVVSGNSVELDLEADGDGNAVDNDQVYEGEEIIDGQTYHATLDTKGNSDSSTYDLKLTWGTDSDFGMTGEASSGVTTAFPTLKTDSGARVAFYDQSQDPSDYGTTLYGFASSMRYSDADGSTDYTDGEAVISTTDTTLDSGDTVVTAGSADLTSFSTTDYAVDGSSNDNDAYDDGEAIFESSDAELDSGDTLTKEGKVDLKNFDASDGVYVNDENTADGNWNSGEDIVADDDGALDGTNTVVLYDGGTQNADGTGDSLEAADGTSPYNDLAYIDANHNGVYDYTLGGDGEAIVNLGDGNTITDGADFTSSYNILAVPSGTTTNVGGQTNGISEDWTQMSTLSLNYAEDGSSGYDGTEAIVDDSNGDGISTLGTISELVTSGTASITQFNSDTKHDNDDGDGTTSYEDGDNIVSSSDTTYDSGDTVITGSLTNGGNIQYWSSDAEETSKVSGLQGILPNSKPGLVVIEEEGEDDVQESYTVSASWDSSEDYLMVDSPSFSDSSKRQTDTLESDDEITAGYDQFGVYTEHDGDDQGSFSLSLPSGQATAGVAFTGADGSLSAEGGSTGSAEVNTPTGFPDSAALDTDSNVESAQENSNMILVGGPAVNALTQELADNDQSWSSSEYSEGEGLVQLVQNAFTEGQDALVVAGYSGEDTRAAANYIANYADNSEDLAGQSQVTVSTN